MSCFSSWFCSSASGASTLAACGFALTASLSVLASGCGKSRSEPTPSVEPLAGAGGAAEGSAPGVAGSSPNADLPDHDDLVVRSSKMSAYEGLTVFATFDHNAGENSRSDPRWDLVSSGSFELEWVRGFDRDTYGAYVVLFVDADGDALCTHDSEPAWYAFADNDFSLGQPVILDFDPASNGMPITCAQFNTWFGEAYRPPVR